MTQKRKILELFQSGDISEKAVSELLRAGTETQKLKPDTASSPVYEEPIAIIGMACRLPGADNVDAYWRNLWEGVSSVDVVPNERWKPESYYNETEHPGLGYARWGGFLDDIYGFDHDFFSLSKQEASALDPQQRIMLEVGYHAFEHAGYGRDSEKRQRTGIFIGGRNNNYGREYFEELRNSSLSGAPDIPINRASLLGKSQNFLACWMSDRLNLKGPAMVVDTACSSSLVSFHLACQSLRLGESDMALAGGVDLLIDPMTYVMLSKAKALSPDGACFVFDSRANGYVPGEGAGAVLLKPLSAAKRDGDRIYATVCASAVNNDGKTMGITTPNMDAQIALLESIYTPERIHPESVGYIEAHGTGTTIGDPIEVKALSEVFRRHTKKYGYCPVGSVKTNIGHLHSAAGIASLIKATLCLHQGALPASLNCDNPNPRFEFINSPFYPSLNRRPWPRNHQVRRVGISGFGFGGTNCHIVLEEAPQINKAISHSSKPAAACLPLSATTEGGLIHVAESYKALLTEKPDDFTAICNSAQTERVFHSHRLAITASTPETCVHALEQYIAKPQHPILNMATGVAADRSGSPVLTLWVGWQSNPSKWQGWSALFNDIPEFNQLVSNIIDTLPQHTASPLLQALESCSQPNGDTALLGSAIFPYALAQALQQYGLKPPRFVGDDLAQRLSQSKDIASLLSQIEHRPSSSDASLTQKNAPTSEEWFVDCITAIQSNQQPKTLHNIAIWSHEGPRQGIIQLLAAGFSKGATIRWPLEYGTQNFSKFALPLTLYNRAVCRLPEAQEPIKPTKQPSRIHPLIDNYERDQNDVIRFQRRYTIDDVLLNDHRVLDTAMIPGVAWLEFLRVGWNLGEQLPAETTEQFCLNDITFLQPLTIKESEAVVAEAIIEPNGHFEVYAQRLDESNNRELLLRGTLSGASLPQQNKAIQPEALELGSRTMGDDVYAQLRALGYLHGPFFQNIHWMADWGQDQTYACLHRAVRPKDWPRLLLDPGMLDSATIVAFGSSNSTSVRSGGSPFIPMFLGKVYVYAPIPDKAYVHTRIHVWNTEMCRCSQVIVDEHQRPCVVIEDIVSKRVPDNSFTTDTERNVENNAESIDVVDQSTEPTIANISEPAVNVSETTLSEEGLLGFLGNIMKIDLAQGDLDTPFLSLGMDSASLVEMTSRVEANIEGQLYPTIFFEYPTPREFLAFLIEEYASSLPTSQIDEPAVQEEITAPPLVSLPTPPSPHYEPIAVIGMAGRYPQANNLDAFWENLCNGTDCVTDIPEQRWDWRNYFNENVGTPGKTYSRWGAFLDNVGHFDPSFFGIAPSEAANHDPQARLFHTVAWETLEHAGYGARHSTPKNTGVWVGYSHDHYYEQRIKGEEHQLRGLGLETSVANQFSYFMDWHGPSLVVNTLCSSSLVAVHQAAHSLQRGECEMALVGGVHAALSPEYYISMSHQRALSPSGRCRTFDISADGYVPGEGVGAVLLKPLNKALEDGDRVWGVIKGSANNHGGRASRATAPNPAAQTDVIRKAMQLANVKSEEISYVETHGTGTKIGDPLEIGALKKAFGNVSQGENKCRLGSLKSAIGHLESAAGIAGLHKLLLSLNHGVLPPTCHVRETNPALELDGSGFVLNNQLSQWQTQGKRIAGLSAFGLLGVNAHLIIEEAPAQPLPPQGNTKTFHTLTVSARNETGLQKLVERYVKLDNISSEVLPHFCFTANTGRTHFDYRVAAAGTSWNEIKQRLVLWLNGSKSSNEPMLCAGKKPRKQTGIAFMFTGQGAQYSGMAKALYESQPRFRLALDKCVQAFGPHMDTPLLPIIFETNGTQAINDTRYSQPALFSIEYALATLWMHWGIAPKALIGHSIGEYVAACIAGVMSLEDSARLVAARGRLMQSTGGKIGAMVAVLSAPEHFQDELKQHSKLNIAALNSPENTVISGCREQMQVFTQMLRNKDVKFTPLKVSHAFHSTLMDPIKHQFLDVARSIVYQKPNMPMISNVTGELLAKAPDADYWWRHLLGTVRFSQGIQTLNTMDISVYLELGPNAVLSGLAAKTLNSSSVVALPSLRLGVDDEQAVCQHIMQLYAHGIPIDWNGFYSDCVCIRQPLPSYPFDEKNYWIESRVNASEPIRHNHSIVTETENTFSVAHPLLGDVVVTENPSNLHRTDGELPQFQQNTMHKEI